MQRAGSTGAVAPGGGKSDLEKSRFILSHSLQGLRKAVERLAARIEQRHSHWSAYAASRAHYADADLKAKRDFVERVVQRAGARWVLDVGANTGEFSEMASAHANVVGIDLDEVSVSAIHSQTRKSGKSIQALVVDLSQPTPACGWRNTERKSFLQRAAGRFDLALMLAVGHHLRVTAGVPLEQILETGLQLGGGSLLFEFVPTPDPMFRCHRARSRGAVHGQYRRELRGAARGPRAHRTQGTVAERAHPVLGTSSLSTAATRRWTGSAPLALRMGEIAGACTTRKCLKTSTQQTHDNTTSNRLGANDQSACCVDPN